MLINRGARRNPCKKIGDFTLGPPLNRRRVVTLFSLKFINTTVYLSRKNISSSPCFPEGGWGGGGTHSTFIVRGGVVGRTFVLRAMGQAFVQSDYTSERNNFRCRLVVDDHDCNIYRAELVRQRRARTMVSSRIRISIVVDGSDGRPVIILIIVLQNGVALHVRRTLPGDWGGGSTSV